MNESEEWLHMNKDTAYKKILRCTDKVQIRGVGRYLDKVKQFIMCEMVEGL
jgi:hypothetical protein